MAIGTAVAATAVAGSAAWLTGSADPGDESCGKPAVDELRAVARRASVVLEGDVSGPVRLTDGQTTTGGWGMVLRATLVGSPPQAPVAIWPPLDVGEIAAGRHIVFAVPHPGTRTDGRQQAGYDAVAAGAVYRVTDRELRRVCRTGVSAPVNRSVLDAVLGRP